MVSLLLLATLYSITFRIFRSCCKCRYGHSKYWDFDKIVTCKKVCNFVDTLTNHQRESWLREEVGTRMRLGIEHLTDESIGQLMLSHEIEEGIDEDDAEEDIVENSESINAPSHASLRRQTKRSAIEDKIDELRSESVVKRVQANKNKQRLIGHFSYDMLQASSVSQATEL